MLISLLLPSLDRNKQSSDKTEFFVWALGGLFLSELMLMHFQPILYNKAYCVHQRLINLTSFPCSVHICSKLDCS